MQIFSNDASVFRSEIYVRYWTEKIARKLRSSESALLMQKKVDR